MRVEHFGMENIKKKKFSEAHEWVNSSQIAAKRKPVNI